MQWRGREYSQVRVQEKEKIIPVSSKTGEGLKIRFTPLLILPFFLHFLYPFLSLPFTQSPSRVRRVTRQGRVRAAHTGRRGVEGRALEAGEAGVYAGQKLGRESSRGECRVEGLFQEVGHRGHGVFLTDGRTDPMGPHGKNKRAELLTAEEEVTKTKGEKLKMNSGFVAEKNTPV